MNLANESHKSAAPGPWQALDAQTLLAGLGHADHHVRSLAAIAMAHQPGPLPLSLAQKLLHNIAHDEPNRAFVYLMPLFERLDDAAKLQLALKATRAVYRHASGEDAEYLADAVWRVILGSPLSVLEESWTAVEAAAAAQGVDLESIDFRRQAAQTSAGEAWRWLQDHLSELGSEPEEAPPSADAEDLEDQRLALERQGDEMLKVVLRAETPSTGEVLAAIRTRTFADLLLEDYLFQIAAARGGPEALETLFTRFHAALADGDEFAPDACVEALAEYMTEATLERTVAELRALRHAEAKPEAAEASELLARLLMLARHPNTPALLLPLLHEGDRYDAVAYQVIAVLCKFPDAAIIQTVVDWSTGAANAERLKECADDILSSCALLGLPLADRGVWEGRRAQYEEDTERFLEEMDDDLEEELEREHRPLVRMEPKVGRNDPCPCGSGKKYKKCCLE